MRIALALLALLAGCDEARPPDADERAGLALERAAIAAGAVPDPRALDPVGAFGSESDRLCVVRSPRGFIVGAAVDHGDGQRCLARGTARGRERMTIDFGQGCRFEARHDGTRIAFPAVVPAECARACTGRATLSALAAERLSAAEAEARAMRGHDDQPLCNT